MNESPDLMRLECADNNPKIITRIIRFVTKSYIVDICNDCKKRVEFQGEEFQTFRSFKKNAIKKVTIHPKSSKESTRGLKLL